jgi:hypothetical protein
MKMCLVTHQKAIRQVWIFSQYSLNLTTQLQVYLYAPTTQISLSSQPEWVKSQGQNAGSAVHSCQASHSSWCLRANRLGLRPTDANTRAVFSGVLSENSRPGGFLQVTEPSSLHCIHGLYLEMGLPVDSGHTKSAPGLCNWPRSNKDFHSTHAHTHTHSTHAHTHARVL